MISDYNEKTGTIIDIIDSIKQLNSRPSWDEYFMAGCHLISKRSSCDRLHVGCIITSNNRIITTGYNGFIANTPHVGCVRDGHEKLTIHAEVNAIADAAKRGVSLDNSIVYITHYPCIDCCKAVVASGIRNIIYYDDYKNDELVSVLCQRSGVSINKFHASK